MEQKKKKKRSTTHRKIRPKEQIDTEFLLLDFSNKSTWSVEAISNLYKKYSIIHTKRGEKPDSENFCTTKHKPLLRYYFRDDEVDLSLGPKTMEFYFSPSRSEYHEIFLMLQASQREYRAFLERCIAGQFDLQFINERLAKMPTQFTWDLENYWIPKIIPSTPLLPDVESYIDWEIISVVFAQKGPQVFGKLGKCKYCKSFFVYRRKSKMYCNAKCKAAYHRTKNPEETRAYKRRRWAEGRDQ